MYPLKATTKLYSSSIWKADTDSLSEELVNKITLEEKINGLMKI